MQKCMPAKQGKNEAKNCVDIFARFVHNVLDMYSGEIYEQILRRLKHDLAQSQEVEKQMAQLAPEYNKYLDLRKRLQDHERSSEKLTAVLSPEVAALATEQVSGTLSEQKKKKLAYLRQQLQLWEAVEQFLRFVPEARVHEILDFLEYAKITASRQAVEAAIKAHPKVFVVRKQRREKYISLREHA